MLPETVLIIAHHRGVDWLLRLGLGLGLRLGLRLSLGSSLRLDLRMGLRVHLVAMGLVNGGLSTSRVSRRHW